MDIITENQANDFLANYKLDFDELFGEEEILVGKNIRISKPVLTKYEFVRLLTDRTKQLAQGAKQMLKNTQELSSKEIAKLEIKEGIIPLIIERPIPNSKNVNPIAKPKEKMLSIFIKIVLANKCSPPIVKTRRSKWPANIFANNRSESVAGLTMK